jgi:hypothetical protein
MFIKLELIFLSKVIAGPYSLGRNINIYFQSLIDELNKIW